MNISSGELKKLEKIGSGNFGTIYRKGNQVLKVYNEKVKANGYDLVNNPMLAHRLATINKCRRLIKKNSVVQNTDLIDDILFVDNIFSGVTMPYYDGDLFLKLSKRPLSERINPARKLVANAKELTNNCIYPMDYKLINMFYVNGEVRIVDLDDVLTKVLLFRSSFKAKESILILDETIKDFFQSFPLHYYEKEVYDHILRKKNEWNKTYEEILSFIESQQIKQRLLFTDGSLDISNERLLDGSRVLLVYDKYNKDEILRIIQELNSKGIFVYDLVCSKDIDEYINNCCTEDCFISTNGKIMTLKKPFI